MARLRRGAGLYDANLEAVETIALSEVHAPGDFGRVRFDNDCHIIRFDKKSAHGEPAFSNAGVYCFAPDICDYIPKEGAASLELDVFPELLQRSAPVFAYSCDVFSTSARPNASAQCSVTLLSDGDR